MKPFHLIFLLIFTVSLTACQSAKAPDVEKPSSGVVQEEGGLAEANESVECPINPIAEGWWCYYFNPVAFMLLTDDFESYGSERSGNFIAAETNGFIHVGGFPFAAFDSESQELFKAGKLKEYILFEQEQFCGEREDCPSKLIEDSFEDLTLGGRQFFKYTVEILKDGNTIKSLHYATLLKNSLIDFSSSEDEQIPVPFNSDTMVSSVMVDEALFESMLETFVER